MMLEIVSPEWRYSNGPAGDFEYILQVKEQRRLGTSRWGTCTPQAPAIVVRLPKKVMSIEDGEICVKADLWSFGPSFKGKNVLNHRAPDAVGSAFSKLRANTYITCTENIEKFTDDKGDGYVYAKLKCFVTRGARVYCRKNHVALRLSVVSKREGTMKEIDSIPWVRTARLSISEKAMCPRESDRKRKTTSIKQEVPDLLAHPVKRQKASETKPNLLKRTNTVALPQSLMPPSLLPYLLQPDLFVGQQQLCTNPLKPSASEKLVDTLLSYTNGAFPFSDALALKELSNGYANSGLPLLYPPSSLFS